MHERKAYVFVGQSGSGKGTQVKLLETAILAKDQLLRCFHITTGDRFREMIARDSSYTIHQTKEYMEQGKLPPSFLGIHSWAHSLIYDYMGEDIVFMDGTPRIVEEVLPLLGALEFLQIQPVVIYIKVGDDWAHEKAKGRGRADDQDEAELRGRLAWFHDRVIPVIEMLHADPRVHYVEVNGEQTIDAVHAEILTALQLN